METTASPAKTPQWLRWVLLACAAALVGFFAFNGLSVVGRAIALGLGGILLLQFISRVPGTLLLAIVPVLILTPNFGGWRIFDLVVPVLVVLAWSASKKLQDRRVWEVHGPGLVAILILLAPLPGAVMSESQTSFMGSYKELIIYALVFLSLLRLVDRRDSQALLWSLPLLGLVATFQLLVKTKGLGALLGRSGYRNFYSDLGWGQSNGIAATLLVCLCGTALVALLDRRIWVRVGLMGASALMIQAFLILSSRSATVALAAFVLVLVLGTGGLVSLVALAAGGAVAFAGLSLSSGRLLINRFADPAEYASVTERQQLWAAAWARFVEHPWFGIGLNQGRVYGDAMGRARAHNWMLDTLMEQGIVGGIAIVIAVAAILSMCMRIAPTGEPRKDRRIRVVCFAMIVAVILQSMVEPTLLGVIVTLPFLWFLAWLTLQDRAVARRSAP